MMSPYYCRHSSRTMIAVAAALGLAGCSSGADLPQLPQIGPPDLSLPSVRNYLKTVATLAKLQPPVEISKPIPAAAIASIPWIVCLRSGATEETKRRTYAVFFKNNEPSDFRNSVIIEHCEAQTFSPL